MNESVVALNAVAVAVVTGTSSVTIPLLSESKMDDSAVVILLLSATTSRESSGVALALVIIATSMVSGPLTESRGSASAVERFPNSIRYVDSLDDDGIPTDCVAPGLSVEFVFCSAEKRLVDTAVVTLPSETSDESSDGRTPDNAADTFPLSDATELLSESSTDDEDCEIAPSVVDVDRLSADSTDDRFDTIEPSEIEEDVASGWSVELVAPTTTPFATVSVPSSPDSTPVEAAVIAPPTAVVLSVD